MSLKRILLIDTNARSIRSEREALTRLGVLFDTCEGPTVAGGCPLLRDERCSKLDKADGVIFQLNVDHPANRRLLDAYIYHANDWGVPVCAVGTDGQSSVSAGDGLVTWIPHMLLDSLDAFATRVKSRLRKTDELPSSSTIERRSDASLQE